MITRRQALKLVSATGAAALLSGCAPAGTAETRRLRVLATSDTHGMFVPWDYTLDEEDPSGSMAKLASAIAELRDQDTLLLDAGDTIQDNMADLFLDDEVHPMIACMNAIGYEFGATGNHEYNFGMDVVRKTVKTFMGTVLTGNVKDEHGDPVADGYAIVKKGDVRVGLIGMVTPNIIHWDEVNLRGCTVTNPVEETRKIIDSIKNDVDVLVGVMHMGLDNEFDQPNTGVRDLVAACPEFDLVVAAHQHKLVEGEEINGVLVVENLFHAQTMAVVDLTLERNGNGWKVASRASNPVKAADYEPDPKIMELMAPYDERAKQYAREVIGALEGGPLAPTNEFAAIPQTILMDTALVDLINEVQLYYSGAKVSAASISYVDANLAPGPIRRCDVSLIYKYQNTLYTLEMTGAQLKKYLEWSASFYNTFREGDLSPSFDPNTPLYCYDMFEGINYTIDVSKEAGNRILDLSWPDGAPVQDDQTFVIVVNNYRSTSDLLVPGTIYEEDNMPTLLESDVQGYIGDVRAMIADYIQNVKGGKIVPERNNNWSVVGYNWDEDMHKRAVELVANGTLELKGDQKHLPSYAITEDDVRRVDSNEG